MVEAILRAAAQLFADLGYARTTTNKVAERAGVSVGSLYQYFPNKDSLLAVLLQRHVAEAHAAVGGALRLLADPAVPLDVGIGALLDRLVALHEADPELTQALSPSVLRESAAADGHHDHPGDAALVDRVAALLAARPDVRSGDHRAMAAVINQALGQLTPWLVHEPPPNVDREGLVAEVKLLVVAYLRGSPAQS